MKMRGLSRAGPESKYIERAIEFPAERLSGRLLDVKAPVIQKSANRGRFLDDFPWLAGRPIRFDLTAKGLASGTTCACQVSYWLWMNRRISPTPAFAKKIISGLRLIYGRDAIVPK